MEPLKGKGDPEGKDHPQPQAEWTPSPTKGSDDEETRTLETMLGEFSMSDANAASAPTLSNPEKFDKGLLDREFIVDSRYYDERDFQYHRSNEFPQTHQPLRPILHSRGSKKKLVTIPSLTIDEEQIPTDEFPEPKSMHPRHRPTFLLLSSDEHGQGSSSPKNDFHELMDHNMKKVQFEVGGTPFNVEQAQNEKKKYKVPLVEDPQERLRPGDFRDASEVPLLHSSGIDLSDLSEVDKNHLSSHRFDNAKGYRRHKFATKGQFQDEDSFTSATPRHPKYDHEPHEIFVELDILSGRGEKREWKESARWIKYEEDLEEGADRWGKPHVASLSFHSLINLRQLLETGVVLLDLEERDLPGVAYRVVEQMGLSELILMEEKAQVLRSLLLKHRHVNESGRVWNLAMKRSPGSHTSLQTVFEDRSHRKGLTTVQSIDPGMFQENQTQSRNDAAKGITYQRSVPSHMYTTAFGGRDIRRRNSAGNAHAHSHLEVNMAKLGPGLSEEDLKWIEKESTLMRQIPNDSEATIVLVGNDDGLHGVTIAFVRLAESVYMPNTTEVPIPVRFLFILMGPSSADLDYKEIGRSIATLMSNHQFHLIAYQAEDRRDLLKGINDFLDTCIVLPHGDWDDDLIPFHDIKEKNKATQRRKLQQSVKGEFPFVPRSPSRPPITDGQPQFRRTGRLFGGVLAEVRMRFPHYLSDIRDGINVQCLATIIFLYFACISGSIAFGDLLYVKTDEYIGIPESLLGSAVGGVLFSLFAGQPLLIVSATGPTLVFDESLFMFCKRNGMDGHEILAVRCWVGFWIAVIGLVVACFEGSVLIRFFTRFTQEVMSVFISFVFIYESFASLVKIYREHPLLDSYNSTSLVEKEKANVENDEHAPPVPRPNVALLSTILMLGTFYIAFFFRKFKNGIYLNKSMRKILGNFGVLIAIVVMSGMDSLIQHPSTDKLRIPSVTDGLKNSNPAKRDWIIQPLDLPFHWIYASVIPAFLLYILIFIETSIAGLVVGKPEYKLRKGSGYHLDMLILCLINTVMGFWGLPWISSAIVRAMSHVVALTVYSTNNPPGEKAMITGVKEQRLTTFVVSILLGTSVLMGPLLKLIPMAVLFGVFLYMGISSMAGIQLLQRFKLFFKQTENYPEVAYVRKVRTWKMHLFTLIQGILLAVVWVVKGSPAALALPFVIILLIPFRYFLLPQIFTSSELKALDSQGGGDDEEKKEDRLDLNSSENGNTKKKSEQSNGRLGISDELDLNLGKERANGEDLGELTFRSI